MPDPASSQHLRVVDEHGEIHDYVGCPRCRDMEVGDVENLEKHNRQLLRKIKRMEKDKTAERAADPRRWEIMRLIELWKTLTGHPKALASADRFDLIKARLEEGYTEEHIELAIEGLAKYPYVTEEGRSEKGAKRQRHDRMGIALANGESLERFANFGAEARMG